MANLGTLWFGADIDLTNLKQKIQQGNTDILKGLNITYYPSSYAEMVNKLRASLSKEVFEIRVDANAQKARETINQTLNSLASTGQINPLNPAALGNVEQLKLRVIETGESVRRTNAYIQDLQRQLEMVRKTGGAFSPEAQRIQQEITRAKLSLIEEKDVLGQTVYQRKLATLAQSQLNQQKREGAAAAKELNSDSIRLNTTLANGIHISTRLGSALSSLFAVDAARQFLENVIEIGGQLEMQRISIGAILDDISHANELFGQIKDLAIKSPFGVVELDQYSKQLSAYGFQYNELYDMTKRLADISAGAGQDIGRLTLALGHVRSATYLTGITLRQFSMNNIPMLRMLADYYSELEHRAVSTAEVTKRISQKQVSYEDVVEQIYRMTDAGGKFYNMQEKVSTSLKAKFKNLKDSFDIMYGEIAESKIGDALKELAAMLTAFSRNWKTVGISLGVVVAEFGMAKLAMFAFNAGVNQSTLDVGILARSTQKLTAEMIENMLVTNQITKAQLLNAVACKRITVSQAQLAASTFGVTEAQLTQIATSGKVNAALIGNAMAMSKFSVAQLRYIASMRSMNTQYMLNAYGLNRFGNVLLRGKIMALGLKNAIGGLVTTLKGLMPMLATFAAIGLVTDLIADNTRKAEEQAQLLADLTERSTEGYRNMLEVRKKFAVGASREMDDESMSMAIDDMVEKLKDYSLTATETFNNAFAIDKEGKSVHSLSEQYEILAKAVDDTTKAYKELDEIKPLITEAIKAGEADFSGTLLDEDFNRGIMNIGNKLFGWFTDWAAGKEFRVATMDFKESLGFYVEAMNQTTVAENKFLQSRMEAVRVLEKMGYKEVIEMDNEELLTFLTQMQYTAPYAFKKFSWALKGEAKESLDAMIESWDRLGIASYNAESRMSDMGQNLYNSLSAFYENKDVQEWPDEWKEIVLSAANEATKGVQGFADLSKEAQNEIYNAFLKPFKITIDTNEAQERVNNLLVELQNLVGRDWVVKIGVKGESSIDDAEAAIKAYKKAVADMHDTQQRLDKMQEEGKKGSEAYNQTMRDNLNAIKARDAALEIMKEYGVDIAKVDEEINKNKTKSATQGKDTQLEEAKTRFEEIKSFLDEYKKYVEAYGKEKSIDILEGMFPTTKGKGKKIVENFKDVLQYIRKSLEMDSEARKKFGISIDKYIADFDLNEAKKVIDASLKDMQDYISSQSEKYNLYKTLFDKTGSRKFAEAAFADGRVWDEVAKGFEEMLKQLSGEDIIDYDMYDGAAKEHYKGVNGAYELWKKIVEITRKNYNDALTKGADALAKQMTIEEKIRAEEEKINELREKRKNESDKAVRESIELQIQEGQKKLDKLNYEKFQQSIEYLEFFGATLALTDSEVQKIGMDIKTRLLKELSDGTITAHDYAKTIKDVNERMEESASMMRGEFSAFLQGGQKGLVNMRNNAVAKWAIEVEDAQKKIEEAQREGNSEAMYAAMQRKVTAENELKAASEALGISVHNLQTLSKVLMVIQVVNGALDGFQNVTKNLSDMFDALGKQGNADFWSDVSDSIGAISSSLNPLNNLLSNAMSGNASGIVSSAISAPVEMFTAPITAFAKLHDKQMEREIQASKQRVKEMENLTKNLETALGRSLSGVYGIKASESMLKELEEKIFSWQWVEDLNTPVKNKSGVVTGYKLSKEYQRKNYMSSETEEALNRAKETKTYYDAQYASLRAQHDEIRHQMDMEEGKKKSNAQAIEDYKQQIAEIEDEIKNFSLDMAKALYDIDVKSWADELGDALFEAWQKGESGAEAFKKKVGEIIAETTKNIVSQKIIGKALENVEQYIAESMVASSGELDPVAFAKGLSEKLNMAFAEIDSTLAPALDATEAAISKYGYSMKEAGESGVSAGIKSITEETADLLASYVNAIRADLSLVREVQITHLPVISEACMRSNILAEQQVQEQRQIAANTLRNAEAAELIYDILHNNVLGANKFAVA